MPDVVEVPGMKFRGLKIYLESEGDKKDEVAVAHFVRWIESYTGNLVKDNAFYHLKAKQTLGIT